MEEKKVTSFLEADSASGSEASIRKDDVTKKISIEKKEEEKKK